MVLHEFLLLATAHWLALVSPGPDFLLLLRNALRHGRCNGIGTSLGIACANGVYIVMALAGFSVLQHSPALLLAMKLLAGGYLAYIGWAFIRASRIPQPLMRQRTDGEAKTHHGFFKGFAAGFLSGGLNPKNGLFYLGLFTLMVGATTGMEIKMLYGAWMFAAVFIWDAALVLAVSDERVAVRIARYFPHAEWLAGVVLLVAALGIVAATLVA